MNLSTMFTAILVAASLEKNSEAKEAPFIVIAQAMQLQPGVP